jgi:KAP family P-loop domain
MNTLSSPSNHWHDDLLNRKQYADFLTAYVNQKCGANQPALVLALDAAWGLGKSFFVERWAKDLVDDRRPVICFNAWENDSSEDAAISFMAEIRAGLAPLSDRLPKVVAVQSAVQTKTKEMIGNFRKAVMPGAAVIAKALLKKGTGIAIDEVFSASDVDDSDSAADGILAATPEALEKGLDQFFEKALKGHTERIQSVKDFRSNLEDVLKLLRDNDAVVGPLYIFVDELDRCRPDYAIRLLEGMKHLFSVQGVVFVISTNLAQLSRAVSAVYGPHFNGYSYLQRFFDFEYALPDPSRLQFINAKMRFSRVHMSSDISGLDPRYEQENGSAHVMNVVATAFNLSLRSMQRVFVMADSVMSSIGNGTRVVYLWLFFMVALRHEHPEEFNAMQNSTYDLEHFQSYCRRVLGGSRNVRMAVLNNNGQKTADTSIDLVDVLSIIYETSKRTLTEAKAHCNGIDFDSQYPEVLRLNLFANWPYTDRGNLHPITQYGKLVLAAGYIST